MNPSGAVRLGNTLYRISEVAWLKVQRLTLWEKLVNGLMIIFGVLFIVGMQKAKGSWFSLEALLGLLPICLGLAIHGDARLGSSGDTQDSYFGRGLGLDVNLKELSRPLREAGGFLEINGGGNAYYYLINTDRIAWVSSWFTANTWPLLMGLLFFGYNWVLDQHFPMLNVPKPLDQLHILSYANAGQLGLVQFAAFMCGLSGVLGLLASIKTGVIVGSVGGVADTMHMFKADRTRLLDIVAGQSGPPQPVLGTSVVVDSSSPMVS